MPWAPCTEDILRGLETPDAVQFLNPTLSDTMFLPLKRYINTEKKFFKTYHECWGEVVPLLPLQLCFNQLVKGNTVVLIFRNPDTQVNPDGRTLIPLFMQISRILRAGLAYKGLESISTEFQNICSMYNTHFLKVNEKLLLLMHVCSALWR